MHGAIPPLPQYAFMAWCLVKAGGQLYLYPLGALIAKEIQRKQPTVIPNNKILMCWKS
jgi:hypothetical protein